VYKTFNNKASVSTLTGKIDLENAFSKGSSLPESHRKMIGSSYTPEILTKTEDQVIRIKNKNLP
jgi:hypothetical protein